MQIPVTLEAWAALGSTQPCSEALSSDSIRRVAAAWGFLNVIPHPAPGL